MSSYAIFFLAFPMLFSLTKSNGYDDYTPPSPPPSPSPPPPLANRCHPSSTCDSKNGKINVSYPFWRREYSNGSRIVCGYPEFGIDCSNSDYGYPILRLKDDTFLVKKINYKEKTIVLADADVSPKCPRPIHNFTLNQKPPLLYNKIDLHFTFYFNCTNNIFGDAHDVFPLECLSYYDSFEGNNFSSYLHVGLPNYYVPDWSRFCDDVVETTVMKTEEIAKKNFGLAMSNGFVLDWRAVEECGRCESTGGVCAQDMTRSGEIVCFCATTKGSCPSNNTSKDDYRALKIGIAFGGLAFGVLLIGGAWFMYQRRQKKRYASSSYMMSQSMPSNPSSSIIDIEKVGHYHGVHIFDYSELEEATENFDPKNELGDGGFGTVYKGKLRDGRVVAVKRLYENNYKRVEQFMNEIEILACLRQRNLVMLYGCTSRHSRELLLVYEYIANGTIADHLHGNRARPGSLSWGTRLSIAVETASALAYLHAHDVIHRDVKTNNVLLDENFCVKVADFGLARLFPTHVTHVSTAPQGTPGYVDPEYHECYQLTNKSDVYSFGVVLIELISSLPAVDITRHRHEINLSNMAINKIQCNALHEMVDPHLGYETDTKVKAMINAVAELAFQCLQNGREMRPSIQEVLESLLEIQKSMYSSSSTDDHHSQYSKGNSPNDASQLLKKKNNEPITLSPNSVINAQWPSRSTTNSSTSS